jgi:hypothetical protein
MRWRILGGLLVVLATGWLLAGAAASTFARAGSATYPAGLAGASWVQAPGGGQHAYFRLSLNLAAIPDLATLWVDADQQYQVYANGEDVAGSLPPTKYGRPPLVDPVDLSWRLHTGSNGIGVEVVNSDGGAAALRAELTLDFGGKQVSYVTSPAAWQAASSARQVHFAGSDPKDASFSAASFDASQWPYAVPATAVLPPGLSLMPPAVVAGPLTGKVISAGGGHDMLASTVIRVPPGIRDAWLRVIASDAYSIAVDGRAIASQPVTYFHTGTGTERRSQAAVNVYNIGPYLRPGHDLVLVHVYGNGPAMAYLDGVIDGDTGPAPIATGPGWHAAPPALVAAGQAPAEPAVVLGPVSRVWPNGVRRTGVVPGLTPKGSTSATVPQSQTPAALVSGVPSAVSLDYALIGMALALGLWLGSGLVTARVAQRPLGHALLADAAGHLPALAAAGAVATLARLPNWVPPWPYIPTVFWLLIATLAAGKLSAFYGPAATSRGWPRLTWPPRPRLRVRMTPATMARHSARRPAIRTATSGRLTFLPRLAMAEAAQAGAVPVEADSKPAWHPAGRPRPGRLGRLPGRARQYLSRAASSLTWASGGVILIALGSIGQLAYRLGYQPYSGDETVSLLAAQSIRAHLLPRFPSGSLYLKGELYEYVLAVYSFIVGQGQVALRLLTVLTYGATVLAFGLLLLPLVLKWEHRLAQVVLTLLFATAPMELQEAQLVRMYQQEQLFAILFVSFFLLALRTSRAAAGLEQQPATPGGRLWTLAARWSIPLSAVTLVCMYLSLEESFIVLAAIPVVLVGGLGLRWLHDRRWLRWGLPALVVIGIQYCLTIVTKMPVLGFDRSNKPYIYYDPTQIYYYLAHYLLAIPGGSGGTPVGSGNGTLYLITSLAVVAGAVGLARRDFSRLYLSTFLWLPVLVLGTVFSAYAERYMLILLPVLFALAGLGALDILGWLRALLTVASEERERRLIAGLILAATVPGLIWLAGSIPARLQDYGLALSSLTGIPYAKQQPNYGMVAAYMEAHERAGDLFITLASTTATAYYADRPPGMVIQPHPNKLLFLTEKDGIVVDIYYGRPVILTAANLQQVMATYRRIWLMTDQGPYFDSVPADVTQLIRAQFTEVAGDAMTALYFRGSLCLPPGG